MVRQKPIKVRRAAAKSYESQNSNQKKSDSDFEKNFV